MDGDTVTHDTPSNDAANGPVRLARFSYVDGNVSWRPDSTSEWSDASVNLPIRQGAQIWVTGHGRAEIQFDDGSYLRLGDSAVATLQSLYSDENGEFTEIRLNDGLASLRLRNARSLYQVDTALGAVTASGPARVRIGSDTGLEVAVRDGSATVESADGDTTLEAGDYGYLPVQDDTLVVDAIPDEDSWDSFNDSRDRLADNPDSQSQQYLPSSIGLVAGDLDDYGQWHHDSHYGEVWCPSVSDSSWRPYEHGHWVWVDPFGWTWVSDERWGWAPYHYGTWVHESWGWSWVPGPERQYWCPAVVHFTDCDGEIAWVALSPADIHYTNITVIGFANDDWWHHYSIGGCAIYEPVDDDDYCRARPWRNGDINRDRVIVPSRPIGPIVRSNPYVPYNARHGEGVCRVASTQFAIANGYHPVESGGADLFRRGRWVSTGAQRPLAGPITIAPTPQSYTPTRSFNPARPSPARLEQPVFRARVPEAVAQTSDRSGQFVTTPRTPPSNNEPRRVYTWHGGPDMNQTAPARHNDVDRPQPTIRHDADPTPSRPTSSNGWHGDTSQSNYPPSSNGWHRDTPRPSDPAPYNRPRDNGNDGSRPSSSRWHNTDRPSRSSDDGSSNRRSSSEWHNDDRPSRSSDDNNSNSRSSSSADEGNGRQSTPSQPSSGGGRWTSPR
jgi:hypothetical protein